MSRFDLLLERVATPEEATALAVGLRGRDDGASLFDRAVLLALEDPDGSAGLARRLVGTLPGSYPAEVRWLQALHGAEPPEGGGEGPLCEAVRVRHAAEADLPSALHDARGASDHVLFQTCLGIALAGRGLAQRAEGAVPALLDPARSLIHLPGTTLDLGRAPRRFALLWALATTPGAMGREALFERVWGRPWLEEEDAPALHATVSRTRTMLPDGLDVAGLPGGAYALEPAWAVYAPRDAPVDGAPLAPLGRDAEAAAARLALREAGRVVLHGEPGSGTSRLGRAIAEAWPAGSLVLDLRAGRPDLGEVSRLRGDRLLVLDHADALEALDEGIRPVLLVRTAPLDGWPAVELGPLAPREAASLARGLGVPDPGAPALPLALRLGPDPLRETRPSARRLLARLLAVPGGAPTGLARRLGGMDVIATLEDLETLEARRLIRRRGDRIVAEDALRARVAPEPLPDVVADWEARRRPLPPAALAEQVEAALANPDLEGSNVALRRAVAACQEAPGLRARAMLALAEVAARSGRPDPRVEAELSALDALAGSTPLSVGHRLFLGERDLWRGELGRAREALGNVAREARHLGAAALEEAAWTALAEADLRRGLPEACASALDRAATVGDRFSARRTALAAALALDLGQVARAADHLVGAPDDPAVHLRRGQLAELQGGDARPYYRAAVEGFTPTDRRWLPVALSLLARSEPLQAGPLLAQARAALSPADAGSVAALTLVEAGLQGRKPSALRALRLPGHADTTTFPWDLVRFLCLGPGASGSPSPPR